MGDFTLARMRLRPTADALPSTGLRDEHIGAALGYVAHLVHLIARLLGVPLLYALTPRGSRSLVHDMPQLDEVPAAAARRTYQLYTRNVDRVNFATGEYFLNRDIEQLLHLYGISLLPGELRHTLYNLQALLERATSAAKYAVRSAQCRPHARV